MFSNDFSRIKKLGRYLTQDKKTILIELGDEGWKFTCNNYDINIDNGLYFGNKNSYTNNQNIFISGISHNQTENIKWEIKKIL